MAEQTQRKDPFIQLQQFITDWERRIDGVANRVMGTDEFARSANVLQNVQLGLQRAFLDAMATHLNNLNMPSREDINILGEAVMGLDQRLARIEQQLQKIASMPDQAGPTRKGPPRTKRPPSQRGMSSSAGDPS
ncbi:MAG: hypothetical protein V2I63_07630 [Pseudomonadales bacterium]|jgi:hypothetical protein|nr:hypothetical protein [Pseudomonadales bacterium]